MARIDDVKRENLSPRQQQLHDDFLLSRPRKHADRAILGA